ncbi:MAG: P-loop NTPase fold protein, partial [Pseudomonadota bacterium]
MSSLAPDHLIDMDVNEELKKYLMHYCATNVAPGYAVMLRGPWGSGKTWFVESLRKSLSEKLDMRSLYVSLYGVKNHSDVTDQFFQQIHPKLANKNVQKIWTLGKSFLKGTLKIDWDGDGKEDGTLQISIPDIEKWASTSGAILIFDDLERVGMELKDILGYINQFVEHGGYRVIVIANEEKCSEKLTGFPTIKEKVIGRTFEIKPNAFLALDHFIGEIKESKTAFEILKERKDIILKVFNRS